MSQYQRWTLEDGCIVNVATGLVLEVGDSREVYSAERRMGSHSQKWEFVDNYIISKHTGLIETYVLDLVDVKEYTHVCLVHKHHLRHDDSQKWDWSNEGFVVNRRTGWLLSLDEGHQKGGRIHLIRRLVTGVTGLVGGVAGAATGAVAGAGLGAVGGLAHGAVDGAHTGANIGTGGFLHDHHHGGSAAAGMGMGGAGAGGAYGGAQQGGFVQGGTQPGFVQGGGAPTTVVYGMPQPTTTVIYTQGPPSMIPQQQQGFVQGQQNFQSGGGMGMGGGIAPGMAAGAGLGAAAGSNFQGGNNYPAGGAGFTETSNTGGHHGHGVGAALGGAAATGVGATVVDKVRSGKDKVKSKVGGSGHDSDSSDDEHHHHKGKKLLVGAGLAAVGVALGAAHEHHKKHEEFKNNATPIPSGTPGVTTETVGTNNYAGNAAVGGGIGTAGAGFYDNRRDNVVVEERH